MSAYEQMQAAKTGDALEKAKKKDDRRDYRGGSYYFYEVLVWSLMVR